MALRMIRFSAAISPWSRLLAARKSSIAVRTAITMTSAVAMSSSLTGGQGSWSEISTGGLLQDGEAGCELATQRAPFLSFYCPHGDHLTRGVRASRASCPGRAPFRQRHAGGG